MNIRSLNAERDGATYNFSPTDLNCDPDRRVGGQHLRHPRRPRRRRRPEHQVALRRRDRLRSRAAGRPDLVGRRARHLPQPAADHRGHVRPVGHLRQLRVLQPRLLDRGLPRRRLPAGLPRSTRRGGTSRGSSSPAQKRLSDHWMLYASYLYSTLQGNYDGAFRAIGGFFAKDPNITDDFDYPEFQVNAYGKLYARPLAPGEAAGGVRLPVRPDGLRVGLLPDGDAALAHRLVEQLRRARDLHHPARKRGQDAQRRTSSTRTSTTA